jgi:glyceraldehyde-3-phosphate dehydrogenase/erythrose-4-phosphate dehydrogenase
MSFSGLLLKYESTHGPFKGTIQVVDESTFEINGKHIKVTSQRYLHMARLKVSFRFPFFN